MLFSLVIRRCYKLLGFGILRFHTRFGFFLLKITIVPLANMSIWLTYVLYKSFDCLCITGRTQMRKLNLIIPIPKG